MGADRPGGGCAGGGICGGAAVGRQPQAANGWRGVRRRYLAGRDAAFAGYDGGWAYGVPYVITLKRGGQGITYSIASRKRLLTQTYGP